MPARRTVLKAGLLGITAAALPAIPGLSARATSPGLSGPSLPPRGEREPAGTRIKRIAGTGVLFQYGMVVPSFDGWTHREPGRDYRSLDGNWRFRFDPHDEGLIDGWHRPDADVSAWDAITVPSAWDLKDTLGFGGYDGTDFGTGTAFQDGYAWYRTRIWIPSMWITKWVNLNFLAVNYRADVWIDGTYAGAHEGGHTPFAMPVSGALRPGRDAIIVVRVHRRASFTDYTTGSGPISDPLAVPSKPVDYWPYAGITRSAWLEAVPVVTLPKVLVSAQDGRLEARVVVANRSSRRFSGRVVVEPGPGSSGTRATALVDVDAGKATVVTLSLAIPDAPSWGPDSPHLLRATARLYAGKASSVGLPVDQLSTTYGVRSVRTDGTLLTVSDAPVFLKGINWHEETAASGRAMTREEYDHELGHALETGANFLRNCVYNRHPYAYQWADEHGVFVMDDIDNMWLSLDEQRVQTEQYGLSRALAATMAWNQHNRPSVILWCLQNESEIDWSDGAPVYRAWLQDMKDAVKALDIQGRPVTWASGSSWDPAFDIADVVGFNEYFGFFYGQNSDLGPTIDAVHGNHPGKPILITENGSWSTLGHHGPETEQGTEEWQAMNFRSHWEQCAARADYVAGYTFWVLKDYKQRAGYNEELNGISVMGLLGFDSTTSRLVHQDFASAQPPR